MSESKNLDRLGECMEERSVARLKKKVFAHCFKLVFSHDMISIYELKIDFSSCAFHVFGFLCDQRLDEMSLTLKQALEVCQEFSSQSNKELVFALLKTESGFCTTELSSGEDGVLLSAHTITESSVVNKKQKILIRREVD